MDLQLWKESQPRRTWHPVPQDFHPTFPCDVTKSPVTYCFCLGLQQARSLMPLADEAASKLLVKEGPDGTVKFNNPAVGDFQVLDALVEVSAATPKCVRCVSSLCGLIESPSPRTVRRRPCAWSVQHAANIFFPGALVPLLPNPVHVPPDPPRVRLYIGLCFLDPPTQYPGSFDLKIIGVDDDTFVSDIRKAVAGCLTNGEDSLIKCSTREKGKYTSITIKVHVENSTQLYKVTQLPFLF